MSLESSTPVGKFVILDFICRGVEANFYGYNFLSHLVMLSIPDYYLTLNMDWVSPFRIKLYSYVKTVIFQLQGQDNNVVSNTGGNFL